MRSGGLQDLRKILGNIGFIIVLLSDMNNERAIFLLNGINNLISCLCTLKHCLVMLKFFFVDLQRTLLGITHVRLLRKNQGLKNTSRFYTLHSKHLLLVQYITAEVSDPKCGEMFAQKLCLR